MSDKPREPKDRVISTPTPPNVQTTRETEAPGVLGSAPHPESAPATGHHTLDDGRVIQGSASAPAAATVEMYTPAADVTETDVNGSVIQIAAKGVPMPLAEARRLGLVKDRQQSGPQETKG